MNSAQQLSQQLIRAIAQEQLLHQGREEQLRQAERWERRAQLALRLGDEVMASQALDRWRQAVERSEAYGREFANQSEAIRALKRHLTLVDLPSAPRSSAADRSVEARLDELTENDRLERDLAALKAKLQSD